jgi:hypothetical protein
MYYFIDFEDHYSQNDSLVKFRLNDRIFGQLQAVTYLMLPNY